MNKRQTSLMTKEQIQAELEEKKRATQTKLDRTRLAIVYIRQSTRGQTAKNKEAKGMQSVDLVDMALRQYEWPEKHIFPLDENLLDKRGNKLDKPRAASGRLDKNFRAGLRISEEMIEEDKVGAVFVRDVPRLFRDPDMINPPQFAALCKKHNVVIITPDQEFEFNATGRDDLKDFLEEAQAGADYLKWLRRTLLRAKERKGMRGDFAGHAVPTGLMLDEQRKDYVPNPYWCDTVAWLTRRFRELDADLSALRNEILGVPIFSELPEEIKERIGRIQLRPVPGGYTIVGRGSLIDLLINPANIGHKVYNRRVVKENAHAAIVDKEDYDYALAHLGKVDLEGNTIERPQRATRFTPGQRREGLLAGVRGDGRPVIASNQGGVYILQLERGSAVYSIKDNRSLSPNPYRGAISIDTIDNAVSQRLEEKVHDLLIEADDGYVERMAQGWETLRTESPTDAIDRLIAVEQELYGRARAILDHVLSLRQQVRASLGKIDETIADVEKKIAWKQCEYEAAKDVMADEDIREHFSSLARLCTRLDDLKEKRAQVNQTDQDIETVKSRLTRTKEEWGTMDLEQRRSFIRLITNTIKLDTLSGRWMKLTIEWSPVLAGENYIEFALFLRMLKATPRWTTEEKAIVRDMFPQSPKSDILAALPRRSWHAITLRARGKSTPQTIMDTLSLEDLVVINEYGINQEWLEEGHTEYWGIADTVINSDGISS